ncbi:peptide deformylase [Candidatus Uhrbacteria bacterium]|jgi:peptide deformylase|nr:peptide deformylase [Candidatus Uhrbacteria bacterium]
MSSLPLVQVPADSLRTKSREITREELTSAKIQTLIDDMAETMDVEGGVGLAAPQIGEHLRIIVVARKTGTEAYINPEITQRSLRKMKSEEACLSIPGVVGIVQRHKVVSIKALDRNGAEVLIPDLGGFMSVVFQHEIDHLDGILFIDRAKKISHAKGDVLV